MFTWLLVIIIVVLIFNADKMPAWKKDLKKLSQQGWEMAKKGTAKAQAKIAEAKKNKEAKEKKEESKKED